MSDEIDRLKRDLQTMQTAMGLDIWTRRDVRRGFLGALAGALASLSLAVWMGAGGAPEIGMFLYLVLLQGIIILKAIGYRANPAPSPGTQREVNFYNRYYFTGLGVIGCFYFWGQRQGIDMQFLFASIVVIAGLWYLFYGISSPARSLSLAGAVPLTIGGFLLPEANGLTQAFCWLGIIGSLGCGFEAVWLLVAVRQSGGAASPPSLTQTPVGSPPKGPLPAHAAHQF
jgi:hypothetical protein